MQLASFGTLLGAEFDDCDADGEEERHDGEHVEDGFGADEEGLVCRREGVSGCFDDLCP